MTVGTNIRTLRKARGLTLNQLAVQIGSDVGNLSRIERDIQGYSEQMLGKLSAALSVPMAALFAENDAQLMQLITPPGVVLTEHAPFDENVRPAPLSKATRPIPVISAVQAGKLKDMANPYEPGDGYDVEYIDDPRLSRWTFGLDVDGESMTPRFQPGDRLIVDPDRQPRPGSFVVARNGSDQATFKKYRPRGIDGNGNEVFELAPLNDDYPTMRSDTEHLMVIGVVVKVIQSLI